MVRAGQQLGLEKISAAGEIASATARDPSLLADAIGALDDQNSSAALAGLDGAHQASRASAPRMMALYA